MFIVCVQNKSRTVITASKHLDPVRDTSCWFRNCISSSQRKGKWRRKWGPCRLFAVVATITTDIWSKYWCHTGVSNNASYCPSLVWVIMVAHASALWEDGPANNQITMSSSQGCKAPTFLEPEFLMGHLLWPGERYFWRECREILRVQCTNMNMTLYMFFFCFFFALFCVRYDDIRSSYIVTWSNKTPLGVCTTELGGRDVVAFLNISYEGNSNSYLGYNHYLGYIVSYAVHNKSYVRDDTLPWRHNGYDGVWNHRRLHCLLNYWFRHTSKNTSKLRVTGLSEGNSPITGVFPTQKVSNAENISIWWRLHGVLCRRYSHMTDNYNLPISHIDDTWPFHTSIRVKIEHLQTFVGLNCVIKRMVIDMLKFYYRIRAG